MSASMKNVLVGLFVLLSVAAFATIILFLKPTVGDGKQTFYVRFSNIDSLGVGTRVLFAGKPVGEVVSVDEITDARSEPTDELGRVYFYQLKLHVDSSVKIYNTDEICIQTSGLLGEKSIGITPKAPPRGITPTLLGQNPVYANSVDLFQSAILDFSDLAASMEEAFSLASTWMTDHGQTVAHAVHSASKATDHVSDAMHTLKKQNAFANAAHTIENLSSTSKMVKQTCSDICAGKGSVGKLVTDDALYLQTEAILSHANQLTKDLGQYGLLFNLNKTWQRAHLQKADKAKALLSPKFFSTYFDNEVEKIQASLSNLSNLIEEAQGLPNKQVILQSPPFRRDLANLLRRAQNLYEQINFYNQQIDHLGRNDG